MGKGIQIKKPDHAASAQAFNSMSQPADALQWFYYALLGLTFPAALVALFFFFQTRSA